MMKKRIAGIAVALCLLLSAVAVADGTALSVGTIVGGPVTAYDGIWNNANAVGTLPTGTAVVILQWYGQWVQVHARAERIVGWVSAGSVRQDQGSTVYTGIVISQNVSLREERSTGSRRITSIPNGVMLDILEEQNGWYYVNYYSSGGLMPVQGWCVADYIVRDPSYVTTDKPTYVYATPSRSSKKVGQVISGTQLVIIGEWEDFWVVNLRSASGFIYKPDIQYVTYNGGNG